MVLHEHDDSQIGKFPVDGTNLWSIITGENETTVHEHTIGLL